VRLPILTYHSFDESGSPISVAPATFRRHLARLHAAGYIALPLSEALERAGGPTRRQPAPARERVVALTFDDGYAAVYRYALPLLADYGWRATVFPVTDYLDRDNAWPGQPAFVPPARLLAWEELRELASLGWEVGAHSRTHPDLTRLDDRALTEEVIGAKAVLEHRLGQPVQAFAYPYGRCDRRVRAAVHTAYRVACTTVMGVARGTSDRYAIERLDMWYFSRAPLDGLLASPWMEPYAALCRAGRRGRGEVQQAIRCLSTGRRSAGGD